MNDRPYFVYKHTAPNGKIYIGITSNAPEKRFQNGNGYAGNPYFSNAIKKYGWNNIRHEILFSGLEKSEAEEKERSIIRSLNSSNRDYGYNIDLGGTCPGRCSNETRAKISANHADVSGENNPRYGVQVSDETRARMIGSLKEKHPWRGKKQTEEAKRKISRANTGKKRNDDFCAQLGNRMRGNQFFLGKKHSESTKEKMRGPRESVSGKNNLRAKRVEQLNDCGEIVAKFDSALMAERLFTKTQHPSNISACCRGKQKTAYGYAWRYAICEVIR